MSVDLKEFAEYLRKLRSMHNYTQEYLGNILDMSYSSYGKYEVGASKLHLEQAVKLSQLYKLSLDDFYAMKLEASKKDEYTTVSEPQATYSKRAAVSVIIELDGTMNKLERALSIITNINTALAH